MANELQFYGLIAQTGLTVVARVYTDAGAQVGSDVSCPEVGTSAIYIGNMPVTVAGTYAVRFVSAGEAVGSGVIEWDGTAEVTGVITKAAIDTKPTLAQMEASVDLTAVADVSGLATSASIAALNDFNPATDTVARVTLVDTTATNTDMRGTDGANTVSPDNASIAAILVDTNDLQTNQSDWVTATGFATPANVTASQTAIQSDIAGLNNLSSEDVTAAVPTTAEIEAALLNEGDGQQLIDAIVTSIGNTNLDEVTLVAAIRSDIERAGGMLDTVPTLTDIEASSILAKTSDVAGLNDIAASDVWSVATRTVTGGDVTATNMRGTDGANTIAPFSTDLTPVLNAIALLNDVTPAEVRAAFNAVDFQDKNTELEIHTWLDSYANKDAYKAAAVDLSAIETKVQADARQALLIAAHAQTQLDISNISSGGSYDDTILIGKVDDIQASVDAIPLIDLTGIALTTDITTSEGVITTAISNKAVTPATDISTLATSVELAAVDTKLDSLNVSVDLTPVQNVVDEILLDTNELQSNQVTLAGIALTSDVTAARDTVTAAIAAKAVTPATDLTPVIDALSTPSEIYAEFTAGTNADAFKADVTGLSTFNPAVDTVSRVSLVDVTTENSDYIPAPTAQDIRTELSVELARIDTPVSLVSSDALDLSSLENSIDSLDVSIRSAISDTAYLRSEFQTIRGSVSEGYRRKLSDASCVFTFTNGDTPTIPVSLKISGNNFEIPAETIVRCSLISMSTSQILIEPFEVFSTDSGSNWLNSQFAVSLTAAQTESLPIGDAYLEIELSRVGYKQTFIRDHITIRQGFIT